MLYLYVYTRIEQQNKIYCLYQTLHRLNPEKPQHQEQNIKKGERKEKEWTSDPHLRKKNPKKNHNIRQEHITKQEKWYFKGSKWGSPRGVVANVLDCDFIVSGFEFQSHYYVRFRTNTKRKAWTLLSPCQGLNTTTVVLQGLLWH